jgi:hypothetical protein
MSTWLDHWDRRYIDRVRLLVEILPVLAQEPRFALKGGTAINLFEHDLPRLSVDIDLAWLPVHDYAEDAKLIAEALGRLADVLRARPLQLQVQTSAGEGAGTVTRLVASRGRARVQIETTPVMRGTVHPVRRMVVRPRVPDAALIERLVSLRGVGRWTVEMFLIYSLERSDILPVDDFGVREGYGRLKGLEKAPTPRQMREIGEAWSPHRTVAAWYLWRLPSNSKQNLPTA